jgi:hypothetical protein
MRRRLRLGLRRARAETWRCLRRGVASKTVRVCYGLLLRLCRLRIAIPIRTKRGIRVAVRLDLTRIAIARLGGIARSRRALATAGPLRATEQMVEDIAVLRRLRLALLGLSVLLGLLMLRRAGRPALRVGDLRWRQRIVKPCHLSNPSSHKLRHAA